MIAIKDVTNEHDLMIINKSGLTIRLAIESLRTTGRATQGVKLINMRETDEIAAVTRVNHEEEEPEVIEGAEGIVPTEGTDAPKNPATDAGDAAEPTEPTGNPDNN